MKKGIKRRTFILGALTMAVGCGMKLLTNNKIISSTNFSDGKFRNLQIKPMRTEGSSFLGMVNEYIFGGSDNQRPSKTLPSIKTPLNIPLTENTLVWFGHSSYLIQYNGIRILVDPAFQVPFISKTFEGADIYRAEDLPEVDYLVITHDHYDHLDQEIIEKMVNKVKHIICPLGIKELLTRWGHASKDIIEMDWNEQYTLDETQIYCFTAHHTGGRGLFDKDERLWASFLFKLNDYTIYIGGDGGYGPFFANIGSLFTSIDLAILECGQYDKDWKYIHMHPHETHQATLDLRAKKLLPVHWAKYILANHAWNEPIKIISELHNNQYELLTPIIGQKVMLDEDNQFTSWWAES